MDKRAYSFVASPNKVSPANSCKKLKVSTSPKKQKSENNANIINSQDELNNELDGLCFDDDEDEEFLLSVSKIEQNQ